MSVVVRRRHWGDVGALARRARFVFGAQQVHGLLATLGLRRERVRAGAVRGEWLEPDRPLPGVILYVHGGGFVACSAATHRPITAALARYARRRVFSLDYRLAPEHPFPAAQHDVLAAYDWLLDSGVPSSSIVLAGDSAGGNLVLALGVRVRDSGRPAPACIVCFSPWSDLANTGESVRTNDGRCAMFRPENFPDFAAVYLGGARADSPEASPLFAELGGLPPVLLHVGSTELLLDDARRVHARIAAAGGESRLEVFNDTFHCWQMLVPFVPEARASLRAAASFIGEHVA